MKFKYRIIPNKGTTLIRAPPIVWPKEKVPKMTKFSVTSLIIDRFSIRNHRWKAQNLSFSFIRTKNDLGYDFGFSTQGHFWELGNICPLFSLFLKDWLMFNEYRKPLRTGQCIFVIHPNAMTHRWPTCPMKKLFPIMN